MSDGGDPDVTRLLRDLTRELQTLKREVDAERGQGMSTRRQLSRFTSEVAIPGIILLLETNIRALQLLRRTIRLAEGREPQQNTTSATSEVRDRAEQLGQATLSRLDTTLAQMQSELEKQETDGEVSEILDEARHLQQEIHDQLGPDKSETTSENGADASEEVGIDTPESDAVEIDVDAELRSLKDNLEDDQPNGTSDEGTGSDGGSGSGDDARNSDVDDDTNESDRSDNDHGSPDTPSGENGSGSGSR